MGTVADIEFFKLISKDIVFWKMPSWFWVPTGRDTGQDARSTFCRSMGFQPMCRTAIRTAIPLCRNGRDARYKLRSPKTLPIKKPLGIAEG